MWVCECRVITLQGEDAAPQRVYDGEQGHLIGHVEEVVSQWFAGNGFNLVYKFMDFSSTFVLTVVVSQNLETHNQ